MVLHSKESYTSDAGLYKQGIYPTM